MTTTLPTSLDVLDAAATAAARLVDPAVVQPSADGRTRPQSLAGGAAGIALLHIERAVAGHGDEATAHAWLRTLAREPVSTGPDANLFHGAPTLAFVLHAARPLGGYRRALADLDAVTVAITRERLAAAHARIDRGDPLSMREFDLVHGLVGLGVYHLQAHAEHPITADVLDYLGRLTEPDDRISVHPPWWLPSGLSGMPDADFPHGHGNLGVAHGVSAVIALLSLAILKGHAPPADRDALAALCDWTDQHRQHDGPARQWWPGYVTDGANRPRRHRPSWCYGTAGVARAQQLAGIALHDTARQQFAEDALLIALEDPAQRAALPEIGLCHGQAGLLQSATRMAAASTDPHRADRLRAAQRDLAARLATQLSTRRASPELMDGEAGAVLALHTASAGKTSTGWDAALCLS